MLSESCDCMIVVCSEPPTKISTAPFRRTTKEPTMPDPKESPDMPEREQPTLGEEAELGDDLEVENEDEEDDPESAE